MKNDVRHSQVGNFTVNPIKEKTYIKVVLKSFKFIFFSSKILYSLCKWSVVSGSFLRNIFCDVRLIPSKTGTEGLLLERKL